MENEASCFKETAHQAVSELKGLVSFVSHTNVELRTETPYAKVHHCMHLCIVLSACQPKILLLQPLQLLQLDTLRLCVRLFIS